IWCSPALWLYVVFREDLRECPHSAEKSFLQLVSGRSISIVVSYARGGDLSPLVAELSKSWKF
ncbi:MAG: hypothetical protein E6848_40900, partial [Bradyrhizobium sp.]|nr:hypothetical protein [Bradyrhizobium sp.]